MAVGSRVPQTNSDSEQEDISGPLTAIQEINSLRYDVLRLVKQASKVVMKRRREANNGRIQELYEQLLSLRSLVPYSNPTKRSCVISDALEYKEYLKKQLQQLVCNTSTVEDSGVEVIVLERGLSISVSCEKRANLLPALMEEIEALGLADEEVNISCETNLVIRAFGMQKQENQLKVEEVKRTLMRTIQQGYEKSKFVTSNF